MQRVKCWHRCFEASPAPDQKSKPRLGTRPWQRCQATAGHVKDEKQGFNTCDSEGRQCEA